MLKVHAKVIHLPTNTTFIRGLSSSFTRGIFFDAGDVLYFKPGKGVGLWNLASAKGMSKATYQALMNGPNYRKTKERAYRGEITRTQYFESIVALLGITDAEEVAAGVAILDSESAGVKAFPGEVETLAALKQRSDVALGIITNTAHSSQLKYDYLQRIGIPETTWDCCISSCEVGAIKPEAKIYRLALAAVNLAAERTLFVSHKQIELDGAKQVGMLTCAFNSDEGPLHSDYTIEQFPQLLQLDFLD